MMLQTLPLAFARRYTPSFLKHRWRHINRWAYEVRKRRRNSGPIFVCGGRMEFWPKYGQEFYVREPVFRSTVQECEHLLRQSGEESVLAYFEGSAETFSGIDESRLAHLSIVMQTSLLELWRAHGVQPEALLGLGLGEVAAVYAAGGLGLADALAIGTSWSRLSRLEGAAGGLLEVRVEPTRIGELASGSPAELCPVAVTGERRCILLCALEAMPVVREYLAKERLAWQDIKNGPLRAYHATKLSRHEEELRRPLATLHPEPLARPCYLGTLGRLVPTGTVLGPDYWMAVLQHPVLTHATWRAARGDGYRLVVPIGSEPFGFGGKRLEAEARRRAQLLPAPARGAPEWETFASAKRVLAARGLVRAEPPARLKLELPEFLARFAPQTCTFVDHPAASFEYLRRAGGMHFLPLEHGWLVLEAKLINVVLGAPNLYSSSANSFSPELMGADPPAHTDTRALFQPFFAPQKVRELGEYAAATVARLAAEVADLPSFDFVTDFALGLTRAVNERMIGLDDADAGHLYRRMPRPLYAFGYGNELQRFFEEFFQRHQPSGRSQMLDRMAELVQTGQFTLQNAVSLAKFMWEAGVLTTSMFITRAVHFVMTHPTVAEQLRSRPELVDVFIEELLRLEPPLNLFPRVTTQAVTLGNQHLPAGTKLLCCITAANRDPGRYTRPDEMDLNRPPQRHLAFAGGVHACLGAHLARLETRLVLRWLLTEGKAVRFVDPFAMPQYFSAFSLRALATLPLKFHPAAVT